MAENYTVNYQINVNEQPALQAIQRFQQATLQLEQLTKRFDLVAKSVGKVNSALASIRSTPVKVQIDTSSTEAGLKRVLGLLTQIKTQSKTALASSGVKVTSGTKGTTSIGGMVPLNTRSATSDLTTLTKAIRTTQSSIDAINKRYIHPKANTKTAINSLDALLRKIEQIKTNSKITITATAAGVSKAVPASTNRGTGTPINTQLAPSSQRMTLRNAFTYTPNAHHYLGNVYAGTGTNIMGEMIKGMGLAYGISTLFTGLQRIFTDASEYDNISKTTRNILATHDKRANFQGRFDDMNALMRQVGVETKFTAPEVADAGRFLAMAGLNIEEISQAIRPISDIALIGDTDLGETADVTTNIMTAYQIPAEKMNRVADIMTSTFTSANVTLLDMAESFKYSASLFKKAGIPFEVATASLGILGNAGMKGSQAGTTMRTIIANIYKPTKGQKAAWDALGISRTDEDGNIRNLIDIFADLHEKGFDVKSAYSLFHKTAAQGAVALADAVEEWNSIIASNFLSESLAKKLANEKKNTIQGLWYQITSAFTESGMQGFEQLQEVVTSFLKQILEMAKSPEFARSLKTAMSLAIDMVQMLSGHIKVIMKFVTGLLDMPVIGWVAKLFVQTQMWLFTLTSVLKIVISTGKALQSLTMIRIVAYAKNWVLLLGQALFHLKAINALNFKNLLTLTRNPGIVASGRLQAFDRLRRIRNVSPNFARTAGTVGSGAAQAGAAGAGAGIVTGSGGSAVAGWGALLAPALPYLGVAAAIAGIIAIGAAWHDTRKQANAYLDSISIVNGISMSSHATQTDKYLRIVYDKQSSVNQKLQEYLNLRREELGLVTSGIDEANASTFKEQYSEEWDKFHFSNWRKLAFGIGGADAAVTAVKLANKASNMLPANSPYRFIPEQELVGDNGTVLIRYMGHTYTNSVNDMNRMNAATLLFTKGADSSDGSESQSIVGEFNERFLKATNQAEWDQVYGAFLQRVDEIKQRMDMSLDNITMAQLGELTESQWKRTPAYIYGVIGQVMSQLNYQTLDTANSTMLSNARKLILKYAAGVIPTPQEIQQLLQSMGIEAYNVANGLVYGSDNNTWWNQWGYDPQKGFLGTSTMEPQTAMQNVLGTYTHTQEAVNRFSSAVQPMFSPLLQMPQWGKAGAGMSVSSNKKFNYLTGKFEDIEETGANDTHWKPKSVNNGLANSLHNGSDQSQYKSHYNTNSAAPKQVIVRIDNLMRVDKQMIDMTDERQVAAVENIKQELATALLDVVQDFNANIIS